MKPDDITPEEANDFVRRMNELREERLKYAEALAEGVTIGVLLFALFMAILLWSTPAKAADGLDLSLHGVSKHFASKNRYGTDYNERNYGLGLRYGNGERACQLGFYRNSYFKTSVYAMCEWLPVEVAGVRAGAFLGLVNNYPYNDNRFSPAAGLGLRYSIGRIAPVLRGLPPVKDVTHGAVAGELQFRIYQGE